MIRSILPLVIVPLLSVSCGRQPGVYAAPTQLSTDLGHDPDGARAFVNMDDPQVSDYLVNDISPEPGFRRWTFVHPELRFRVNDTRDLTFTAEFAIPEVTYQVTGPVAVTYRSMAKRSGPSAAITPAISGSPRRCRRA